MHAARRAMPCTMQPRRRTFSYAVKERRADRDGGGRAREGWRPGRREAERKSEKDWHPMGARSFFVMIVILEPDQPRASGPAGRLLLRSISYSSRSRPSGRYATLIPPFAGAIYAHGERRPAAIRYACMPRRDRPSVCPRRGLACNEQNHSDCACHVNYMRDTRIPIAVC